MVDFDVNMLVAMLSTMASTVGKQIEYPDIDASREFVFHDPSFGDGAVDRVHSIQDNRPVYEQASSAIKKEIDWRKSETIRMKTLGYSSSQIEAELASKGGMLSTYLVPTGGDPSSPNLVRDYWTALRTMVKEKLLI